jgi:phosphopantetheinyl transferase (holo-ACP synthase)
MKIYGIGVDLVQNKRIRDIIFKSYLENFLNKVLHQH